MKIILPLIAGYLAYRFIKKSKKAAVKPNGPDFPAPQEKEDTVFDSVCQTYVPRSFAVKVEKEGKVYFFCSENCREKFKESAE